MRPSSSLLAVLALLSSACDDAPNSAPLDAPAAEPRAPATEDVDETAIYELVGRWYPEAEILRLSDRTLTPEEWCRREPSMIFVVPEKITVTCDHGPSVSAMVALARQGTGGHFDVALRAKEGAPLTRLVFDVKGTEASITGSPCDGGRPARYARFPRYEILSREILGGRRCAELAAAAPPPKPLEPAPEAAK